MPGWDSSRSLSARNQHSTPVTLPTPRRLAPVIVVFSAKGGVGKTTFALTLAQTATTTLERLRVCLIDANVGQGDITVNLGLKPTNAPTIADGAFTGNHRAAILTPGAVNEVRGNSVGKIGFATVLAPPPGQRQNSWGKNYTKTIHHARTISDLVVIDTRVLDAIDDSLFDDAILPLLGERDVYTLGISTSNHASLINLATQTQTLLEMGADDKNLFWILNRTEKGTDDLRVVANICQGTSLMSSLLFHNDFCEKQTSATNLGVILDENPVAETCKKVLVHLLGLQFPSPAPPNKWELFRLAMMPG